MTRYDKDWLRQQLQRPGYTVGHHSFTPNSPADSGLRPCPVIQEREAYKPGEIDNLPHQTEVDGAGRPLYRITITLRTSDERDRDADGATSTLLDTYLFALGRLLETDRVSLRKLAKGQERTRGRGHHH